MFKEISKNQITAEEIKNRLLAYTSLQAARETTEDHAWSGNIDTYTLNLRLSGVINEQKFTDVLASTSDGKPNSGKYIYLTNEVFLAETLHLDNYAFVQELYRSFLRREADVGGLTGNVEQLKNGAPRVNLVIGIRNSGEADSVFLRVTNCLDDVTFLDITYKVYLDAQYHAEKQPEDLTALSEGKSREEIFNSIKQFQLLKNVWQNLTGDFALPDTEFLHHNEHLDHAQFVQKLYLTFLKREADPGGLKSHVAQLSSGISRPEILTALRHSAEAAGVFVQLTASLDNETFLLIAYQAYLKQQPNPEQIKLQLEAIHEGKSRQEILIAV